MILGAFGDSFIFGSDLSDLIWKNCDRANYPSKLTYPALVADSLNMDYLCTASPGVGNMIIHDDVCRIIANYGNSVFYYINWTYCDRFDYVSNNLWNTIRPSLDNKKLDSYYYKNLHSELTDKISTLTYISNIIGLLKENKCNFCMSCMDNLIFDTEWHCPPSVRLLQEKVKPYMFYFEGLDFLNWAKRYNYDISENNHPLDLAHKKAAEYWLPKVRTLLNTHAKEDYLHAFI